MAIKNVKDKEGKVIVEEEKIMERWWQYFKELLEGKDISNDKEQVGNVRRKQEMKLKQQEEISMEELKKAIKKAKQGKAPGHEMITAEMLKALSEPALQELLEIMNKVMEEGEAPED